MTAPEITFQLLSGRQAAGHASELQDLHDEVYGDPPYGSDDDAAGYASRFKVHCRQPGFILAEARHGGYLVGYAAGLPLRPSTSWWRNLTIPLADEVTAEHPGRTFALTDLLVRASWRRQGSHEPCTTSSSPIGQRNGRRSRSCPRRLRRNTPSARGAGARSPGPATLAHVRPPATCSSPPSRSAGPNTGGDRQPWMWSGGPGEIQTSPRPPPISKSGRKERYDPRALAESAIPLIPLIPLVTVVTVVKAERPISRLTVE